MEQTERGLQTRELPLRKLYLVSYLTETMGHLLTRSTDGAPTDFRRDTDSLGTTGQAAVVYIPPGMYVLDSPLQLYVGTVLMGDPTNPPTLRAR